MKRNDILIVVALLAAMFLYPAFDRKFIAPLFPAKPASTQSAPAETDTATSSPGADATPESAANPILNPPGGESATAAVPPPAPAPIADVPETIATLTNKLVALKITNRGGAIQSATFAQYNAKLGDGEPLTWNFTEEPSATYLGLQGISAGNGLEAKPVEDKNKVVFSGATLGGVQFTREIELSEKNYYVTIRDTFANPTSGQIVLPPHSIRLGKIHQLDKVSEIMPTLGVDASHLEGEGIRHYNKKVNGWAKDAGKGGWKKEKIRISSDWVALKNKFFTQLLLIRDQQAFDSLEIRVQAKSDGRSADQVGVDATFEALSLNPGDAFTREMRLYVGPKKMSMLKEVGPTTQEAMDFGLWRIFSWIPPILLNLLNFFHDTLPPYNYGVAIILLTLLIRGMFWPLMNANSDQMRKMQALAPEIAELRAKYKTDFQKQNQAIMELYQRHGVNPLASLRGCFPLLLQIPVFFALYGVLRTAVELRYAKFLWINDLSEAENLFAGTLPFSLNILPLLMGVTMFLQQRLTPSTMDEKQKKIMQFFPFMFLFMFYSMPSGLLLYWTTSNLVSIYQLVHKTRKEKAREAAEAAAGGKAPPARAALPSKGATPQKQKKPKR